MRHNLLQLTTVTAAAVTGSSRAQLLPSWSPSLSSNPHSSTAINGKTEARELSNVPSSAKPIGGGGGIRAPVLEADSPWTKGGCRRGPRRGGELAVCSTWPRAATPLLGRFLLLQWGRSLGPEGGPSPCRCIVEFEGSEVLEVQTLPAGHSRPHHGSKTWRRVCLLPATGGWGLSRPERGVLAISLWPSQPACF